MKQKVWLVAAAAAVAIVAFRHPAATAPPAITLTTQPPERKRTHAGRSPSFAPAVVVVYVAGAVLRPGLYELPDGARAGEALRRAGGFLADADTAETNLAQRLSDGEEIRVYHTGERAPRATARPRTRSRKNKAAPVQASLDLNRADEQTLSLLPGIGPILAKRIVAYRDLNGGFASLDELLDVAGMTPRRLDALSAFLTLHDAPSLEANDAA